MSAADAIEVLLARPEQIDTVAEILDEATRWVRERGGRMWPLPFPRERLLARFATGEVYLAWLDGAAVGTFALLFTDPPFWGETPPDALYLHGLAIRRAAASRGVGEALVRWAERRVLELGRQYLRLDCQDDNPRIRRYYEQLGFVDRGPAVVFDQTYRLMEKQMRLNHTEAAR